MRTRDLSELERIVARHERFGHREHLELAWGYLGRYELGDAQRVMSQAIMHLAAAHGAPGKHHETLTRAWVRLVAVHRALRPSGTFAKFIALNPELLDSRLVERHYAPERLWGEAARAGWAEPDLPFPPLTADN